jgi:hypothetical protein
MKLRTIALVVGMLALTACSKLSKENYDRLEMGMTQKEVESIIGSADKCGKTMGTMADKAVTFNYSGLK